MIDSENKFASIISGMIVFYTFGGALIGAWITNNADGALFGCVVGILLSVLVMVIWKKIR